MPIDARIPLGVKQIDLAGSLQKGLALKDTIDNAPKRNQLLDLQLQNQQGQLDKSNADREFDSVLQGALGLEGIIGLGEVDIPKAQQAASFLDTRIREIDARGGDSSGTKTALGFLQQGDFDSLRGGINNVKNIALQTGRLKSPTDNSFTLSPGQSRFDSRGNPVASGAPKTTTLEQNLISAGLQPGTPEFNQAILNSVNKSAVSITNEAEAKGLTEEQKALAKSRVTRFEGIQLAADNAIDQDEQLAQLENIDISTGFGTEARGSLASVVNAIFGEGSGDSLLNLSLPALQAFRGVSARLVNSELNKAKGPQTEGDAQRAKSTLASLTNEGDANRFLVKSLRATNARKIEQAAFYEEVLERDGTLKQADKEWSAFKRKTPMLSDTVLDSASGLPMFFNEFSNKTKAANPSATDEQIVNAWRELNE